MYQDTVYFDNVLRWGYSSIMYQDGFCFGNVLRWGLVSQGIKIGYSWFAPAKQ